MQLKVIIILFMVSALACCRAVKPTIAEQTKETITREKTVTITDTVFMKDSASIMAELNCDSIGNIYIARLEQLQGDYLKLKLDYANKQLNVHANSYSQRRNYEVKNDNVAHKENVIIREKIIEKEKPLSFLMRFQIYGFRVLMLLLIGALILKYWKTIIKIISHG